MPMSWRLLGGKGLVLPSQAQCFRQSKSITTVYTQQVTWEVGSALAPHTDSSSMVCAQASEDEMRCQLKGTREDGPASRIWAFTEHHSLKYLPTSYTKATAISFRGFMEFVPFPCFF